MPTNALHNQWLPLVCKHFFYRLLYLLIYLLGYIAWLERFITCNVHVTSLMTGWTCMLTFLRDSWKHCNKLRTKTSPVVRLSLTRLSNFKGAKRLGANWQGCETTYIRPTNWHVVLLRCFSSNLLTSSFLVFSLSTHPGMSLSGKF